MDAWAFSYGFTLNKGFKRANLGVMVRLQLCNLEVTRSNPENGLLACEGKTVYIYPPKIPLGGSLVHWVAMIYSWGFWSYNFEGLKVV